MRVLGDGQFQPRVVKRVKLPGVSCGKVDYATAGIVPNYPSTLSPSLASVSPRHRRPSGVGLGFSEPYDPVAPSPVSPYGVSSAPQKQRRVIRLSPRAAPVEVAPLAQQTRESAASSQAVRASFSNGACSQMILRDENQFQCLQEEEHEKAKIGRHRREQLRKVGMENRLQARRTTHRRKMVQEQIRKEWSEKMASEAEHVEEGPTCEPDRFARQSIGEMLQKAMERHSLAHEPGAEVKEPLIPGIQPRRRSTTGAVPDITESSTDDIRRGSKVKKKEEEPYRSQENKTPGRLSLQHQHSKVQRLENLRRLTHLDCGERKMRKLMEVRVQQLESLPEEEKALLEKAFAEAGGDQDGGNASDPHAILNGLREMGLGPQRDNEKAELKMIIQEAVVVGDVDFFMFALDIVPRARQRLQEMRENVLLGTFNKYDADGSGLLDHDECLEIVRGLCASDLDYEGGAKLLTRFDELYERTQGPTGEVDFKGFQVMITALQEMHQRLRKERLTYIIDSTGLTPELVAQHKDTLITSFEDFERADLNSNGELDAKELVPVLREYGMIPRDANERTRLLATIETCDNDGDGFITFKEFLKLLHCLREESLVRLRDDLQATFERFDRHGNGTLSMSEISQVFHDVGLLPTCREDQDKIKRLLDETDEDGSGTWEFDEFCSLVQRVSDILRVMKRQREKELGQHLGFSNEQMKDLRVCFFSLDQGYNGCLTYSECQQVLVWMRKSSDSCDLGSLFAEANHSGSGTIEYEEFLQLVKLLEAC